MRCYTGVAGAFLLWITHACAAPHNGSIGRTFGAFFLEATDMPIDYLDVLDGSGSGSAPVVPHTEHKPRVVKTGGYHISKTDSGYLTSPLTTVFIPCVYAVVFVVGLPLNVAAVVTFARRLGSGKPSVIFLFNLSMSDLLFLLLLPFRMSYHFGGNNWVHGATVCRLVTAAFCCNMYCSVLLVTCVSADRFLAVVRPLESLAWRSGQSAAVSCAAVWLLAVAGVSPILVSQQTVHLPDLGITTCHDVLDVHHLRGYYLYFFPIFSSVFFFIPLALTVACYVRVIQALNVAPPVRPSTKRHAVLAAAAVLVVFLLCFAPTNIILLAHYAHVANGRHHTYPAYLLSTCLGSVSCCLDPFLYYFGSAQCRKQAGATLNRCRAALTTVTSAVSGGNSLPSRTFSGKMEMLQSNRVSQYRSMP